MNLSRRRALWWLSLVLLLGAALRLYGLVRISPPGLAHDEVAHWLIVRGILAGRHGIFFAEAYGHEAAFHYVQSLFVLLLGDNVLALRLPAAFAGLLGVAMSHALARRLFGREVALFSTALLALLFWPVFWSRQALRAISLPLVSALSAYLWWRGWGPQAAPPPAHSRRDLSLAGLAAGASLYTYSAARAVPIFYAAFSLYLLLFHRHDWRQRWRGLVHFWLLLVLVSLPLAVYLLQNPGVEVRVAEVNAPLRALFAGDPRPVVDNFVDILAMFGLRGDPLWRQNVAFRPVFDPVVAVLFYGCLLYAFWRFADARYAFLLLWIFTAFIPSLVTINAPSSIRMMNSLPVLALLPAILMHRIRHLSTETAGLSTSRLWVWLTPTMVMAILGLHLVRTADWILFVWPGNEEEVQYVWQAALTDAAAYLDAQAPGAVAIGGWSPESMDAPTMALTLQRDDLDLRHFHPQRALLVPSDDNPRQPARVVLPAILPLHPLLAREVERWGVAASEHGRFREYVFLEQPVPTPDFPAEVSFGGELLFLGHALDETCLTPGTTACQIVTYWQVLQPSGEPRSIFLHALDERGEFLAAGDDLGAPAEFWQPGDLILQRHGLGIGGDAISALQTGVYHPDTGHRQLTASGDDALRLPLTSGD
jgi:4-amino-4-deoxy-L-arabinose transferase-like glycosyltransferase